MRGLAGSTRCKDNGFPGKWNNIPCLFRATASKYKCLIINYSFECILYL
ncbi:hypothetical protein TFKS16_2910 [Tannerella forsythia KS16]|uniref:Uncharacterized protein n=1 Tax=Tannerella forsythia (strain ATCC 43037 / JCM 10827 / CCUG 21028 A / KCTC 5666 / FDC 338) TaxID=203275 RepID=G8UI61_TANFA|nr:hypothetical protein BFO_3226 [Tannerella forsythia 92A2]BAR53072.1 hypothetical protein TFKS16_2910 [Tannerella forsythia KS16]